MASSFYLLHGTSDLLVNEQREAILSRAKQQGFDQRERVTIDPNFDWDKLIVNCQSNDLWSSHRVIDINNSINKLDRKANAALQELAALASPSLLIIVCCGKLTSSQTKAKWYQLLNQHGECRAIRGPSQHEYPQWLIQRAKDHSINLTKGIATQLAQLTQGNLLAGQQAMEKANLLNIKTIDSGNLSQLILNCAQYQVFDLADSLLQLNPRQCLHILQTLQQQNTEAVLVLWSLSQTCRQLFQMRVAVDQGESLQQVTQRQWASKRTLYQKALQKLSAQLLSNSLQRCHQIDLTIKSQHGAQAWQLMADLCLTVCQAKPSTS